MVGININKKYKDKYDQFLKKADTFFIEQTFEWLDFQKKLPSRSINGVIGVLDDASDFSTMRMTAAYNIIETVFGKNYLHVNRGPVYHKDLLSSDYVVRSFEILKNKLKEVANENNCIYIRFDFPFSGDKDLMFDFEYDHSLRGAHYSFQPRNTLLLDLSPSLESIKKQMKPKGRYNIKIAVREGVKIIEKTDEEGIDEFYKLLSETTSRDGFSGQPKRYYEQMIKHLKETKNIKIYLAKFQNKIIAGSIVTFFGDRATYYYGASANIYRNVMAPYLVQWQAICDAKKAGYKWYDFLGISDPNSDSVAWDGITSFKKKFGGEEFLYSEPREIVLKKHLYYILIGAKKIKKVIKAIF